MNAVTAALNKIRSQEFSKTQAQVASEQKMHAQKIHLQKIHAKKFLGATSIATIVLGFLIAAIIIMTDPHTMLMKDCHNASNLNAFLIFNTLLFFFFSGVTALGEVFHFFENKGRGIPHKSGFLFWAITITITLGSIDLMMLKLSC